MSKVLIITYYWPPSGGSGVQRWLKFSKYLPDNGWNPIIYTPESISFDLQDLELSQDISNTVRVWKHPIWEPYQIKDRFFGKKINSSAGIISEKDSFKNRFLNWVRGNFFIPDPKIFWVSPSIKFLSKKLEEEKITHIISTGPPHSMHLIALGLKKKYPGLQWIADFRDPWSELDLLNDFRLTRFSRLRHRSLEKSVLSKCDLVLTVSESWVKSFQDLGAHNVKLLTNGFDPEDFSEISNNHEKFIIGHYGLLNHLRNPKRLWKTLNDLCQKNEIFNEKLEIRFAGHLDQEVLSEIKAFTLLKDKIKVLGYLNHVDVIKEYRSSSVLLLLLFNSKSGIGNYPGKIFEYFAANKPILAFGPQGSDVEDLLNKTNTGFYQNYNDDNHLASNILDLFEDNVIFRPKDTLRFSRKNLTKDLSEILNSL